MNSITIERPATERRDHTRSYESRQQTLQRRVVRWEKYGFDLRAARTR